MKTITELIIRDKGDESVGIFPATWEIKGDMHFESDEDYEMFKNEILKAFELVTDMPKVLEIKPTIEGEKSKGNHVFIKYFDIYIDQELHKVKEQFITGSQIKAYAKVPNNYGVWLKSIGKESDREISDNEQVDLNQPYRDHFFTGSKAITEG